MSQQTIERDTASHLAVDEPSLLPNELLELAIGVAATYLVGRATDPDKERQAFRQEVHDFCSTQPQDGPGIILAGLRAAGFELELNPPSATAPDIQPPEHALDLEFFYLPNWYNVVPTLIDMGEYATWDHSENPRFDPDITEFAQHVPKFTQPGLLA